MKTFVGRTLTLLAVLAVILAALPGGAQAGTPAERLPAVQAAPDASALAAPDAVTVSVTPNLGSVSGCDILDVYIDVNNVTNLYAVDVRLAFDPAVLEVVDNTPTTAVVDIEPIEDPVLQYKAGFTIRNEVNNFTGTIWYASTQTAPTPAANGSGHIARLRLRAKSSAVSPFTFTYVKMSAPYGVEIPASGVNGSVSASTSVMTSLGISRLNASQVQLSWPVAGGVSKYHLYRSDKPYFSALGTAYQVINNPGSGSLSFNDSVLGNVAVNYFYAVRAECSASAGSLSAASNQVGKFEYTLYETATTDKTWIALPLTGTSIPTARDLAFHIQNNSNGAVNVLTISTWNPAGQSMSLYSHVYNFGNFTLSAKNAYQVEIDLPSGSTVIWAQVGAVPPITSDIYRLYETATTDYSWIMQPLDLSALTLSSYLSADIQNNASASAAVLSVGNWNGSGQSFVIYSHQYGYGDFSTRFGYPYRIEINLNSGSYVTWP